MSECKTCGLKTFDLYEHHIVPVSKGGLDHHGNLISICGVCHGKIHGNPDMSYLTAFKKRHGYSFEEFMEIHDSIASDEEIIENLNIDKSLYTALLRLSGLNKPGTLKVWVEGEFSEYKRLPFIEAHKIMRGYE